MSSRTPSVGEVSTRPAPIPALTGLRTVGAVWVALFHFRATLYQAWPWAEALDPLLSFGVFGVPLFFILSGYIIWHNYGSSRLLAPRAMVRFIWRRFARLWPVNVLTLGMTIPLVWWALDVQNYWGAPKPDWASWGGLLKSAFMVAEIGNPYPVYGWNQPSWSLSAEMVAYVVFPLLLLLLLVIRAARLRATWIWLTIALVTAYVVQIPGFGFPFRWVLELLALFLVGVMLRLAAEPGRPGGRILAIMQVLVPAGVLAGCFLGANAAVATLLGVWVFSLATANGPGVWFFCLRGAQIAGLASYSLYMLHWPLFGYLSLAFFYVPQLEGALPVLILGVPIVLGVLSWVTWRFFESPARRLLNRLFERVWPPTRTARVEPASAEPLVGVSSERAEEPSRGSAT